MKKARSPVLRTSGRIFMLFGVLSDNNNVHYSLNVALSMTVLPQRV